MVGQGGACCSETPPAHIEMTLAPADLLDIPQPTVVCHSGDLDAAVQCQSDLLILAMHEESFTGPGSGYQLQSLRFPIHCRLETTLTCFHGCADGSPKLLSDAAKASLGGDISVRQAIQEFADFNDFRGSPAVRTPCTYVVVAFRARTTAAECLHHPATRLTPISVTSSRSFCSTRQDTALVTRRGGPSRLLGVAGLGKLPSDGCPPSALQALGRQAAAAAQAHRAATVTIAVVPATCATGQVRYATV